MVTLKERDEKQRTRLLAQISLNVNTAELEFLAVPVLSRMPVPVAQVVLPFGQAVSWGLAAVAASVATRKPAGHLEFDVSIGSKVIGPVGVDRPLRNQ